MYRIVSCGSPSLVFNFMEFHLGSNSDDSKGGCRCAAAMRSFSKLLCTLADMSTWIELMCCNNCTKNYWNRTATVEIIVKGWVAYFFAVAGPHCKEQSQDLRVSAQDEDDRYLKLGLLNHFCWVLSQIVRFVFFGFVAELLYRFANHSNFLQPQTSICLSLSKAIIYQWLGLWYQWVLYISRRISASCYDRLVARGCIVPVS